MVAKLVCAVGAGLLLSATLGAAIPLSGLRPGASNSDALAPIPVARHSSSSSSSSSSSHRAPAARSSGSSGARWSAPAARSFSGSAPRHNWNGNSNFNSGARWVRPPTRFARRHVPIRFLSPLFFAGAYYYPYRYLPYDGPVCIGVSDNGCQMQWMDVPDEDNNDSSWQCVEFCPQQ